MWATRPAPGGLSTEEMDIEAYRLRPLHRWVELSMNGLTECGASSKIRQDGGLHKTSVLTTHHSIMMIGRYEQHHLHFDWIWFDSLIKHLPTDSRNWTAHRTTYFRCSFHNSPYNSNVQCVTKTELCAPCVISSTTSQHKVWHSHCVMSCSGRYYKSPPLWDISIISHEVTLPCTFWYRKTSIIVLLRVSSFYKMYISVFI